MSKELEMLSLDSKEDEEEADVEKILSDVAIKDCKDKNHMSLIQSHIVFLNDIEENPFKPLEELKDEEKAKAVKITEAFNKVNQTNSNLSNIRKTDLICSTLIKQIKTE